MRPDFPRRKKIAQSGAVQKAEQAQVTSAINAPMGAEFASFCAGAR